MRTKHEYEANAFASHLIIDDDELIDLMKQDYDVVQLSAAMGTNINLMLIKLNEPVSYTHLAVDEHTLVADAVTFRLAAIAGIFISH